MATTHPAAFPRPSELPPTASSRLGLVWPPRARSGASTWFARFGWLVTPWAAPRQLLTRLCRGIGGLPL